MINFRYYGIIIYIYYFFLKEETAIRKKFLILLTVSVLSVFLCGCTIITGAETYLKPPKLSEQHEQIYKALINASSSRITLKYPKSGQYLSAFVVSDIDDEPTDEAIVFYEKNIITGSDVSSLRINFLDQNEDSTWRSVFDFSPEDASEVERVFISELGASERKNVIIGMGNQNKKTAQLYFYDRNSTEQSKPQQLGLYSAMDVKDLNGDGRNELIMIHTNTEGTGLSVQMKWLDSDNILVSSRETDLSEESSDIAQMIYGKHANTDSAVYIDSYTGTNKIRTDIFYADTVNNKLELRPVEIKNIDNEAIGHTVRNSSLTSKDIDGDEAVEIPINTVFKGYEDKPETEQIAMTNWYAFEDGILIRKYSGYYNINDGYAFMMPSYWLDKVSVKTENNEVIFFKYDESPHNQTELLKLCVVDNEKSKAMSKDGKYAVYETLHTSGDTDYLACIPEKNGNPLIPTPAEVKFCFYAVNK